MHCSNLDLIDTHRRGRAGKVVIGSNLDVAHDQRASISLSAGNPGQRYWRVAAATGKLVPVFRG
jgi:hypothetical protein